MCGICGWLYHDRSRPVEEALLHRAADAMFHRGPDSEGLWAGTGAGLAMRRLAIIDVESGRQPMVSPDGRVILVYNGEIYNHDDLRRELKDRGHSFRTRCDTEVVLHSYLEWGADCLTRFNGMWALAFYDREAHELFLARDRLGIKPLYVTTQPGMTAFASEIKCLFADPAVLKCVDLQALSKFLYYRFVPAPQTGFAGIRKLPPAHYLRILEGREECVRYWHPKLAPPRVTDEGEALEQLDSLLASSVSTRLMSDVPLGVMLSGGVDSSLVAARAAKGHPGIDSFTIGFDTPAYDESRYAKRVAEHLGTSFHREEVAGGALDQLVTIARHVEEPLGDSSMLPLYSLCRMTRKGVTVALAGDGGDELGLGYPRYLWDARAAAFGGVPGFSGAALGLGRLLQVLSPTRELGRRMEKFGRTAARRQTDRYDAWFSIFSWEHQASLFLPEAAREALVPVAERNALAPFFREAEEAEPAVRLQYVDLKTFLAENLLLKADKLSMAASLELRVPFLDHRLAEWMLTLSPKLQMKDGNLKVLLKALCCRDVPPEVIDRPKQGFSVPLAHWFQGGLEGAAAEMLSPERVRARGLFDPKTVSYWVEQARLGRTDVGHRLFSLLYLEAWFQAFEL